MKKLFSIFIIISSLKAYSQFHTLPGTVGTNAVKNDSSIILGWASQCIVNRGLQQIDNPSLGYASIGTEASAVGFADGVDVLSLGDGGSAIITFSHPIKDGAGYDFVVFENSFLDNYMELAFVEISSDGTNYFRFPAISNTDTLSQLGNGGIADASKINNLAGKYRAPFGTPFDISDINDHILLDKTQITHIRIIDVIGSIQPNLGNRDSEGKIINDPFPTPFPSSGFDVDAVAVLHFADGYSNQEFLSTELKLFPNPSSKLIRVEGAISNSSMYIIDMHGKTLIQQSSTDASSIEINIEHLPQGIYILKHNNLCQKFIKN